MLLYNVRERDHVEDAGNSVQRSTHPLDSAAPKSPLTSLSSAGTFDYKCQSNPVIYFDCISKMLIGSTLLVQLENHLTSITDQENFRENARWT